MTISFLVHDCSLRVNSNNSDFIKLISYYLQPFRVANVFNEYSIELNFDPSVAIDVCPYDRGRSRVGDGIYIGKDSLYSVLSK